MSGGRGAELQVELVFAVRERQRLIQLTMPQGSDVRQAIDRSGIAVQFPQFDFAALQAGIWGRPVQQDQVLRDGDRVEIYRPLLIDPREARRKLAAEGRLMGQPPQEPD